MVKKKRMDQEFVETADEPVVVTPASSMGDVRATLEQIKEDDSVIGYILRSSTSAAIDLKDPAKIIDYAIISSSAFDAGNQFSEMFQLGEIASIIVEGKGVRILSLTVDDNRVSVFMDRGADCDKVLKRLRGT